MIYSHTDSCSVHKPVRLNILSIIYDDLHEQQYFCADDSGEFVLCPEL